MRYLITGGCGFFGSNLAAEIMKQGGTLCVMDNLYRHGAVQNLSWLKGHGSFTFFHADIRNTNDVDRVIRESRPNVVFHLAGQVAMTTSIANPRVDFEVNALGTLNLLESVRAHTPDATVIYSSTNKVYGDLTHLHYEEKASRYICVEHPNGLDESVPLSFHSPYGCSKGCADQYVLDFSRIYGIQGVVFRHSSIYGGRQFATIDQGWIGWFCQQALESKRQPSRPPFTISGNGKQVRDVLHVSDAVRCYLLAAQHIDRARGQAFNLGGGIQNSLSLLELFDMLEQLLDMRLRYSRLPPRSSDQLFFVAGNQKAKSILEWEPWISSRCGVEATLKWLADEMSESPEEGCSL